MSYIGGFMRPDYGSDPGIIGIAKFVQSGYDAGKARAQNDALRQLSQKAYTDTGDAQQQDVAQMMGINPEYGSKWATYASQRADKAKADKLAAFQKVGKVASAIASAWQNGDKQTAEAIYQASLPELSLFAAQNGGAQPASTLDQSDIGALYKVAAMYGQLPKDEPYTLTPGSQRYAGNNQLVASVPAAPKITPQGYQAVLGPDGTYHAAQIPLQGAQNGMGMGAAVPGAGAGVPQAPTQPEAGGVQFQFAPGTPQAVIDAAKAAAAASGDMPAQPQQGAPQTLAQVVRAGKGGAGRQAPSGYQWNASHTGLEPIPGGPADKGIGFQGDSSAALFGDPSKTGPEYLKTIPQGNQEIVRGLLDGTVSLPTGTTLKSPLWQSALASVKHADPAWNQAAYKQYADTRKWATTGQGGQLINNINTASYHLDKLRADIQALHNGNFSLINKIGNTVSQATGGQAVTNFKADLTPVASELAAVYKGKGVPSDAEIAHFMNALTPDMSYGQQMNVIRGWIDLLTGKLNSTREQYASGMSKLSSPLSVINPHAAEALERITSLANQVSNTGQHAMPGEDTAPIYAPGQQAAPGAPTPGTVEQGYRFKGGDPANQANWEPVQ